MNQNKKYKESKKNYLGSIPDHWVLSKNRYYLKHKKNGVNNSDDTNVLTLTTKGIKIKKDLSFGKSTESYIGHQLVDKGDIVFTPRDFDQTPILSDVSKYDGCISNLYIVDETKDQLHNHFLNYYWYGLKYSCDYFKKLSHGIRYSFTRAQFDEIPLLIPPLKEQKLISQYLDRKTEQIERLVEKIQKKVELIEEQRTTLINKCVTEGLDLSASMKDSGADWIDKIPKHWRIIKPKYLLNRVTRPVEEDDEVVTCFRDGIVTLRKNRRVDGFTISIKEHGYQQVRPGDLVIHEMDGFAGAIGISDSKGKCTPVYTVIEPDRNNNLQYMAFLLNVMANTGKIESLARSIRERTTDFRWNTWSNIKLPNPPLKEQDLIVNFLEKKNKVYDELVELYKQKKQNLIEYRQSLISTVVTGKFRITEDML